MNKCKFCKLATIKREVCSDSCKGKIYYRKHRNGNARLYRVSKKKVK